MKDIQVLEVFPSKLKPANVAKAQTIEISSQREIIFFQLQPLDFIPVVPAIASGRLEIKTATRSLSDFSDVMCDIIAHL